MKVISHRGASAYAPENTLKAFALAVEMGSEDFEFDVHRTKDGVLVVHHDYSLEHTAGKKFLISKHTFAELEKHNVAAHRRGAGFHAAPSLDAVMDTIAERADWMNFEIKNDGNVYQGIEADLLEFLRRRKLEDKATVSSFDYPTLKRLRALAPDLKLGYLGHGLRSLLLLPAIRRAKAINAEAMHIALRLAFGMNVSRMKKAGFKVRVYTVNHKKDALRLQRLGVDGIFSNHPDILGKWELKG
jgi:glycerophosphoryl diester phosphodiesterase